MNPEQGKEREKSVRALFASFVLKSLPYVVEADQEGLRETECFHMSVAGSPGFVELLGAQGGDERTGQFCHGSRLPQFQPVKVEDVVQ